MIILALAHGSVAPAADLQRWVYCSQNLWVDKNVDDLAAPIRGPGAIQPARDRSEAMSPTSRWERLTIATDLFMPVWHHQVIHYDVQTTSACCRSASRRRPNADHL